MSYLKIITLLATMLLPLVPLNALNVVTNGIKNRALFGIEFPGDARSYHAREAGVLSIAKQEYLTGSFKVLEVNIVTTGPALLRIYHSRALKTGELQTALGNAAQASGTPGSSIIQKSLPSNIQKIADQGAEVADSITSDNVFKEYPIATHSRTIEFRVASRNELLALHDALKRHWLKEPALFEDGQIVNEDGSTQSQMKPRNLGGTLFVVGG
jgi:hypothetical protein